MRKIIVFNLITLDGYFAGEDGNIDWHHVDEEFNDFAVEQTSTFGAIIFGKTTYQMFETFWPEVVKTEKFPGSTEKASPEDLKIAQIIDNVPKIVFSKSLTDVSWKNTTLLHDITSEKIGKLKQQEGNDMFILGSGTIVKQLAEIGMVDEYRLLVNPIILGKGKSMFDGMPDKMGLKLTNSRTFNNGNVLLTYV